MNQATAATMAYLSLNGKDPEWEKKDPNAPILRSLDLAGEYVANYDPSRDGETNEDLIMIATPKDGDDSVKNVYDLQVKDDGTATLTITADYEIRGNAATETFSEVPGVRDVKFGKASYSYAIKITGLGDNGKPHIESVGFSQKITAQEQVNEAEE